MRRAHWLTSNLRRESPREMLFVDTETNIDQVSTSLQKHTLRFGWACYVRRRAEKGREWLHEEWHRFTTMEGFWDLLEALGRPKTRLYIFAHNWNYDAGILGLEHFRVARGWRCVGYANERPPFILRLAQGNKALVFLDTLNWFALPLAALAQAQGCRKLKMPALGAPKARWDRYCRRDVEVIKRTMLEYLGFIREHDLGNFQPTLPAQAFAAYRHRWMPRRILIHDSEDALRVERDAYCGGRVECFRLGQIEEHLTLLDVHSLYPAMMSWHAMPRELLGIWQALSLEQLREVMRHCGAISWVQVETPTPDYPVRHRGRLVFPVGRFWTALATPELVWALARGHVLTVGKGAYYKMHNLFSGYVDAFYALRQQYKAVGNGPYEMMAKLMLNSLYGKFGQLSRKWEDAGEAEGEEVGEWQVQDGPGGEFRRYRVRLGRWERRVKGEEAENSAPAIAAHVTSAGRLSLLTLMQRAGRENVYYVDTDSLLVNRVGRKRLETLIDPSCLGSLKLEYECDEAVIYGNKHYRLGTRLKRKGIRQNARQQGDGTWLQEHFVSWDQMLARGLDGEIEVQTVQKRMDPGYRKGVLQASGRVLPLVADGIIGDPIECDRCHAWTQDWVPDVILTDPFSVGWRDRTRRDVRLCLECAGLTQQPEPAPLVTGPL